MARAASPLDISLDLERRSRKGNMEQRALAIAQVGKCALAPGFIGIECELGLAHELFKSILDETQSRDCIRIRLMHLLPALGQTLNHEAGRFFPLESV